MTVELRKLFESELNGYLKGKFDFCSNVKYLKNEISIKKTASNESSGDVGFRFLNTSHGYILYTGVDSPELLRFFNEINPPYKSNKPEGIVYAMNTSMEVGFKSFSPSMKGTVDLPKNEDERKKACEWIYTKVRDVYLPRVMNLIELKPEAIEDVISFPDYYAYPFLTILYIIKKNNIPLSVLNIESIFSKKILGNKSFDKNLFEAYL
ncbi:hypothetical protein MKU92_003074 [Salmonella enterica]|nr:hypothetical protein [Salmonella enterica]EJW2021877.1 hypothetical protein [Salmonella enterica]EJW2026376.1 hypothetical protein [Salmonella enterica]EJW2102443.1 hypothetical protein [Salmonella enterica]